MAEIEDVNATPWRRDPRQIEAGLIAWARNWRGDDVAVSNLRTPQSGMANDTILFTVDGDALVARLAPAADSDYPTFPTFDLELQTRVIELVRSRTEVPVPEVVHHETDESWVGAPFMVVRAVAGEVANDTPLYLLDPTGWFLRGTPDDWKRLETSTIKLFAQLHCIADDGDDTAFLRVDAPGDTALAQLLASHRAYYDWARDGIEVPILERAYAALAKTIPANERRVVLWGDGRPGNIIYRNFEPVAALDWEMAGVGPPEVDLAWTTFFHRFFSGMAAQFGIDVPAMFDRPEAVATYERLGGATLDDLAWYEALAGYRFGIILLRMSLRGIAYGTQERPDDPNDLMMFAPLLEELLPWTAMQFNLFLPQMRLSFAQLTERAQAAEAAGFAGMTGMDHLAPPLAQDQPMFDAIVTTAWLAAHTERMTLGSLVLCDAFRLPAVLARQAVSIDHASGGRFELGIGWGSVPDEFTTFGVGSTEPRERVARLRETLEVLRALWSGEVVNYDGEYHHLVDAQHVPVPLAPIPIVIGGTGPKTLALVREFADWWNVDISKLHQLDELRPHVPDTPVSIQQMVSFIPRAGDREAIEATTRRRFGWSHPVTGSASELVDHYGTLADSGVARVYTWFCDFAPPETLAEFGEEVIGAFRN